jgi:hypothetical protein
MVIKHTALIAFGQVSHKWVMSMLTSKQIEFIFEWGSTFILLCGAALTSLNVYPMNVFLSLAGNVGWLVVSVMWRKPSLIVIQLVISVIYVAGLIDKGVIQI